MKDLIVPSKEIGKHAAEAGKDMGVVVGGFLATHAGLTLVKKRDSIPVNLAVAGAGFAGAVLFKPALLKLACIGIGTYGTINSAGMLLNKATTPGATQGVAGLLPEGVKEKLRALIPNLSGVEELAGDDFSNIPSMDDAAQNGVGNTEDVDYETISSTSGVGMGAIEQGVAAFA